MAKSNEQGKSRKAQYDEEFYQSFVTVTETVFSVSSLYVIRHLKSETVLEDRRG